MIALLLLLIFPWPTSHKTSVAGDPVTTDLVSSGLHTCNTVKTSFATEPCNWSSGSHVTWCGFNCNVERTSRLHSPGLTHTSAVMPEDTRNVVSWKRKEGCLDNLLRQLLPHHYYSCLEECLLLPLEKEWQEKIKYTAEWNHRINYI